jgi:hypothetical protein
MSQLTAKDIFGFIHQQVDAVAHSRGFATHRAFPLWFAQMYHDAVEEFFSADGAGDGKVDCFFRTVAGKTVTLHAINSKFTGSFNQTAPVGFYDEVIAFHQLFNERLGRDSFLKKKVREELRPFYKGLFDAHDDGRAKLLFLTNCRKNAGQMARVEQLDVQTFHFEDLAQHVLDDLDGAMPRTPDLTLAQIGTTLSPPADEAGVATTLVFARLVDFIEYMNADPYDLLFARNVRVSQGQTAVNRAIAETFSEHPEQFAYSNNGLTILCERATHNHGTHELVLANPRVVNGSQTLHTVAAIVSKASRDALKARVMVRIISIPPASGADAPAKAARTKDIINRISIRSNQQNPIKAWTLRANDNFQMELARRFRRSGYFYERRDREWRTRASQLRNVGIDKGPTLKTLMAQLACYLWKEPKLGPALAKGNLGELFQTEGYDTICEKITPELAYQIHLVHENVSASLRRLPGRTFSTARRHIDLVVFSLVCRSLTEAKAPWGQPSFTAHLETQWDEWRQWQDAWQSLTKTLAATTLAAFEKARHRAGAREEEPTLKNFVRRRDEVSSLLTARLPAALQQVTKRLTE